MVSSLEGVVAQALAFEGRDFQSQSGVKDTPRRVAKFLREFCTPPAINPTFFNEPDAEEMVIVKDVTFSSLCEHHMLPFFGKACVGYIPDGGQIIGLSKIPRVIEHYSAGLKNQERITKNVGRYLAQHQALMPKGVAVIMEATHTCMSIRGVKQSCACTRTQFFSGVLRTDPAARAEFMAAVPAKLL